MNIVNVGYDSTNYYVLADRQPRLLIDVGFPGTLPKLQSACKRQGVDFGAIRQVLATHYHPDHAGLLPELQRLNVSVLVPDVQIAAVDALASLIKPELRFQPLDLSAVQRLSLDESRIWLARLGIAGQILHTPGHSDDSVSLILDDGTAFTGDLPPPMMADSEVVTASWDALRAAGARTICPGHGPAGTL